MLSDAPVGMEGAFTFTEVNGLPASKRIAQRLLRSLGYELARCPPPGADPFEDMERLISPHTPHVVFDVGANVGQSIDAFTTLLPDCIVHSFEPNPRLCEELETTTQDNPNIFVTNTAVGNEIGSRRFYEIDDSDMSSLLEPRGMWRDRVVNEYPVEVTTVDAYCRSRGIGHVHILKTDTQGHDYEVLEGARALMSEARVQMVFTEVNFLEQYRGMASFDRLLGFLVGEGFRLVSFYNFHYQDGLVSWADALFLRTDFCASR